jgi:hypothetical protein
MTVEELIEELETIRARIQVRALSSAEYQAVGWADRPLRQLIDQCRQEQEAQSFTERHCRDLSGLDARLALPEPLPLQLTEASP